jgi:hypothetical protein
LYSVPSDQNDAEGTSFASALDEGVALAGKAPPKIAGDKPLQNAKDGEGSVAVQSLNGLAAAIAGKKKDKNLMIESGFNSTPSAEIGNQRARGDAGVSGTKTAFAAVELPRKNGLKSGIIAASGTGMAVPAGALPEAPDSQAAAGSIQVAGRNSSTVVTDAPQAEASNGIAAPSVDASVSVNPPLPSYTLKPEQAVPGQKELEIAAAPETSNKVAVKKQDEVGKAGKSAKPEKKDEKYAGAAENAAGIEAQIQGMMAVPGGLVQGESQPNKPNGDTEDAAPAVLTSATAPTRGQAGRLAAAGGNSSMPSNGIAVTNAADVKDAAASITGDPASPKAAPDAAKATAHPLAPGTGTKEPSQSSPSAVSPFERGIAGGAAGVAPGSAAAHAPASKPQSETSAFSSGAMGAGPSTGSSMTGGAQVDTAPRTLMASPTALEVGVPNGTHGWLKIRAEMTGGGAVDASLSTSSPSGQEMLHRELPSLMSYLQNEHITVNTVVVHPSRDAGAEFRGLAGGMNGDGRGEGKSGGQGGEGRQQAAGAVLNYPESVRPSIGLPGIGGDEVLPPASYMGGGGWLSVRA